MTARFIWTSTGRKGAAFTVTHSETAQLSDIFEYGFDIGIHIGDGTSWTTLVNASVDNYIAVGDPSTVGVLVDGATAGVSWIGGATSSYGTALKVDTSVLNGNANAVMVSGVALNPGSGQQFARLMPSVDGRAGPRGAERRHQQHGRFRDHHGGPPARPRSSSPAPTSPTSRSGRGTRGRTGPSPSTPVRRSIATACRSSSARAFP